MITFPRITDHFHQNTQPAFTVLPKRWIVERSFAWLGRYRRMSKEYEYLPPSSEALIYAAMSRLMLRRLTHQTVRER